MPGVARIAFAASADHLDLGGELELLAPALDQVGVEAVAVAWDDSAVDWSGYDGVVVRSTWDYTGRVAAFRDWVRSTSAVTLLANPADVVVWNTDKRYLADLAAAGVPVVETRFVAPGRTNEWPDWPELVVKPAVSAGARLTGRFGAADREGASELVAAIHAEGVTVMVQPFLASVDERGESDVLVFGGEPSHAVAKGGILRAGAAWATGPGWVEDEWHRPEPLTDELAAFARLVLEAVPGPRPLVYARVDSALDGSRQRRLMELEAVEPYLFLALAPDPEPAARRFAAATRRWLDG